MERPRHLLCVLPAFTVVFAAVLALDAPDRAAAADPPAAVEGGALARGLTELRGHGARIRLVRTARRGVVARVASARPRGRAFSVHRRPRAVVAAANEVYRAEARVRGGRLCLAVRELSAGRSVGSRRSCLRAARSWRRLAVTYRARRAGTRLTVAVVKRGVRARDTFSVSLLRLGATSCGKKVCSPQAPPSAQPQRGPNPGFGTQFHCTWGFYTDPDRGAVLDKLRAAGVTWVRIDAAWDGVEGEAKGARNLWYIGMLDTCVNEARRRGMQVLVTLWLTPSWANGGRSNRAPPTNPQDYADFARWAAGYWRGRVAAWEVWNEPDLSVFWQGGIAEYASLLRAAYPGFKSGDPDAKVIAAGPSSNDDGWMRELYRLGAKDSFDVAGTHPYQGFGDAAPEEADDGNRWWFSHAPAVHAVMAANGDGHKPIWFTEFGWSAHANWPGMENWQRGVSSEQQADYLVRAIRYARTNFPFVPVMFWYKERARPGSVDAIQEGYALLNADLSERPAYAALRTYLTAP